MFYLRYLLISLFFFSTAPFTSEIYTLSLHDALPIYSGTVAGLHVEATGQRARQVVELRRHHQPFAERDEEMRSEEHTSELQSLRHLVCRLLLEKKKNTTDYDILLEVIAHCASASAYA